MLNFGNAKSLCIFCLTRQNKIHGFVCADQDWIGLKIFKKFADQDWIGFIFCGSGLDLDWKILQSAQSSKPIPVWFPLNKVKQTTSDVYSANTNSPTAKKPLRSCWRQRGTDPRNPKSSPYTPLPQKRIYWQQSRGDHEAGVLEQTLTESAIFAGAGFGVGILNKNRIRSTSSAFSVFTRAFHKIRSSLKG